MPKSKEKPDSRRPIRFLSYAVLWMISMSIATVVSRGFLALDMTRFFTVEQVVMLQLGLGGFLVAFAQARLTERLLKRSMRGWVIYSMIGNLILLFFLLNPYLFNPNLRASVTLRSLILAFSVPLLQTLWLRKHVYKAWLWPLAQGLMLVGTAFLLRNNVLDRDSFAPMLLTRLFGLMCGVLMIYLWSHPRDTEKTKIDFATDNDSDDARLERLQDHDRSNRLWNSGDEQALQSKSR